MVADVKSMKLCIDACFDCYKECSSTLGHCLEMGGKHAEKEHVVLIEDCAAICLTAAEFMLRKSDFHLEICKLSSQVSKACSRHCAQFKNDLPMQMCAAACKRAEEACVVMTRP